MNRKFFGSVFLVGLIFAAAALGQTTASTPAPAPPFETILSEAARQARNYQETFKNLLADERKTFEKFDKNGGVKEQTVVEATFLVYQSPRRQNFSSELRNVTRVNGKLIPDSRQRSERFLAELQKTTTFEKELQKLQKESTRYDKTLEIYGLTIWEAVTLSENLRPFFDFQFEGKENNNGTEVYLVSYRQTRKSPYISLNDQVSRTTEPTLTFDLEVPGALKKTDAFLRGKMWIDAKTFQLWREERHLVVQTAPQPVVLLEIVFEYQASDYGILVPKQISFLSHEIKKNSDLYRAERDLRVNFAYSKFRKTETDVRIIDDNP